MPFVINSKHFYHHPITSFTKRNRFLCLLENHFFTVTSLVAGAVISICRNISSVNIIRGTLELCSDFKATFILSNKLCACKHVVKQSINRIDSLKEFVSVATCSRVFLIFFSSLQKISNQAATSTPGNRKVKEHRETSNNR